MTSDSLDSSEDDSDRILAMIDPFDINKVEDYLVYKFRTKKLNSKGKLVKRTTLPQHFGYLLITRTKNPFEWIIEVARKVRYSDFERPMIKSLGDLLRVVMGIDDSFLERKDFYYYENYQEFSEEMQKQKENIYMIVRYLALEKDESVWLCHWLIALDFKVDSLSNRSDSLTKDQTRALMTRMWNSKAFFELCSFISKYDVAHHIDLNKLIDTLVTGNAVQNITILTQNRPAIQQQVLDYIEGEMYKVIVRKNNNTNQTFCQYSPGIVKRLDPLNWQSKYPATYIAYLHGQTRYYIKLLRATLGTVENLNYQDTKIAESFVDRIAFSIWELDIETASGGKPIRPRELLLDYAVEKMTGLSKYVQMLRDCISCATFPNAQGRYDTIHDPNYYTCSWPIVWVDSLATLQQLSNMAYDTTIIGIDGEWTQSPLSTLQLACYPNKVIFVIDCLAIDGPSLNTVLSQFNCLWVGFDLNQDIPRIESYCGFEMSRYHDLKQQKGGLGDLVEQQLNLKLDKRPRMSLWERRPLHHFQLIYAATDAQVLVELVLIMGIDE